MWVTGAILTNRDLPHFTVASSATEITHRGLKSDVEMLAPRKNVNNYVLNTNVGNKLNCSFIILYLSHILRRFECVDA